MPSLKVICTSSNRIKLSVASSDMAASEGDTLLHPSFYIYILYTYIYFSSMFPVFLFLFTSALFLKRPLYTHTRLRYSFAPSLLYTIPDSFWPGSGYLKIDIYISCLRVYLIPWFQKGEGKDFAPIQSKNEIKDGWSTDANKQTTKSKFQIKVGTSRCQY